MPLVRGRYPTVNPHWLRAGAPAGVYAESLPKIVAGSDLAIAATGVELSAMVPLQAGTVVSSITFVTGGTAAGSPTAGYACLRNPSGVLMAQTAVFGSTARAANTAFTVSLATAQLIPSDGLYRFGISFTASTVPTLRGASLANAALAAVGTPVAVTHGSSVGATAPATTVTPTSVFAVPYLLIA